MLGVIKGDTRSLDYSSYEGRLSQTNSYNTRGRKIVDHTLGHSPLQ